MKFLEVFTQFGGSTPTSCDIVNSVRKSVSLLTTHKRVFCNDAVRELRCKRSCKTHEWDEQSLVWNCVCLFVTQFRSDVAFRDRLYLWHPSTPRLVGILATPIHELTQQHCEIHPTTGRRTVTLFDRFQRTAHSWFRVLYRWPNRDISCERMWSCMAQYTESIVVVRDRSSTNSSRFIGTF